jgi:S1-C subfamily serine protease
LASGRGRGLIPTLPEGVVTEPPVAARPGGGAGGYTSPMTEHTLERGLLAGLSDELADAVEHAAPFVVTVDGRALGAASGVVLDGAGTVVTAAHVLERTTNIGVLFGEDRRADAQLVGRDAGSDLAILRTRPSAPGAPTPASPDDQALARWSAGVPADSLKVGHLVLALGRPDPAAVMATFGVVSALGGAWRTGRGEVVDGYVRTDVGLLPGFSGGPLIDTQGRLVGITSSRLGQGGAVAIPWRAVRAVAAELLSGQRPRRAYLGVSVQPVELQASVRQRLGLREESGLMVLGLEPDGPAARAGLLMGDILLALGERALSDGEALQVALGGGAIGRPTAARVLRGGALVEVTVVPAERPG